MPINRTNLPYYYEDTSQWVLLPNSIEQQTAWEYTVYSCNQTTIIERLSHQYRYCFGNYQISANAVEEWHYLDTKDDYAAQGYRSYWDGVLLHEGKPALQPEVAVMLGMTPDINEIPPFLKTIPLVELLMLMDEAQDTYADKGNLWAHLPRPISAPADAPKEVANTMHQLRKKSGITITRGRAALLEMMMEATGTTLRNGGWQLTEEELERRKMLIY